jgi:hypothetical protein
MSAAVRATNVRARSTEGTMSATTALLEWLGRALARFLNAASRSAHAHAATDLSKLVAQLQPADVLLVEGKRRISVAIKYLTHSNWSHAALYVGPRLGRAPNGEALCFIEADTIAGVRAVPLSEFEGHHVRVCRAKGLSPHDRERVVAYAVRRLGHRYDLRNVLDLARYLLPIPPVPSCWRRRMIALGSGDPTRAICSSLVASAFQSVRYPILPIIERSASDDPTCLGCVREQWHIRHHSLFVPADFDASPYFEIIKPELTAAFDYRQLPWAKVPAAAAGAATRGPRLAWQTSRDGRTTRRAARPAD